VRLNRWQNPRRTGWSIIKQVIEAVYSSQKVELMAHRIKVYAPYSDERGSVDNGLF
jgi:hypothetical protein